MWLMTVRQCGRWRLVGGPMRASIMGPLRYAFSNSLVVSRHSGLSVLARSTKNGLGSSLVESFGRLVKQIVWKARRVDVRVARRVDVQKLTERIVRASYRGALQARRAHLAENAARGPRCEARILGALGQFTVNDSLTCGFSFLMRKHLSGMAE